VAACGTRGGWAIAVAATAVAAWCGYWG